MITNVKLHEYSVEIDTDNIGSRTVMLTGMMTPPFRLEHWDSEKIVIIANEEFRHVLDEQGHFVSSERI